MKLDIEDLIDLVNFDMLDAKSTEQVIEHLKELEATRKALEMACDNFNGSNCPVHKRCPEDKDCKDCCVDYFLIKAVNELGGTYG